MEIMSIPLRQNTTQDVLIWKENRLQLFTVKSAYRVALRMNANIQIEHSIASIK